MHLKETFTYTFENNVLDIYERGHHVVHQPHDSDTGARFSDIDYALAWALKHFPEYFTP